MSARLRAEGVGFDYGRTRILDDAHLDLAAGEVLALLGRNGAGKSTLLRLLLGLLRPGQGRIVLDGRDLISWQRRLVASELAYVPQHHAPPFPYLLRDLVLMGRLPANGWFSAPRRQDRDRADDLLDRFGISHLAARPCTEISGGERQLALLARALIQGARILILDEPMTGLDFGRQCQLLAHLGALAREGHAILMTTHHPEQALAAASRVAVLAGGRIIADGPPSAIMTPALIQRLYGVPVAAIPGPDGRTVAFRPAADSEATPAGAPAATAAD